MMNNNKIYKELKTQFDITKAKSKDYDFNLVMNDKQFQMKVLKVNDRTQVTVNSNTIWELAKGMKNGIRFRKTSSKLVDFSGFNKCENKLLIFTEKPYRILKHVNESDIVVISEEKVINDIKVIRSVKDLVILKK